MICERIHFTYNTVDGSLFFIEWKIYTHCWCENGIRNNRSISVKIYFDLLLEIAHSNSVNRVCKVTVRDVLHKVNTYQCKYQSIDSKDLILFFLSSSFFHSQIKLASVLTFEVFRITGIAFETLLNNLSIVVFLDKDHITYEQSTQMREAWRARTTEIKVWNRRKFYRPNIFISAVFDFIQS